MKLRLKINIVITVLVCLTINLIMAQEPERYCDIDDMITPQFSKSLMFTNSTMTGPFLPTTGTNKALIVFIQFSDDTFGENDAGGGECTQDTVTEWPYELGTLPDWALNSIDANANGTHTPGSLTDYFCKMSRDKNDGDHGKFHLVGEVYPNLIVPDSVKAWYRGLEAQSPGDGWIALNREILEKVSSNPCGINFSSYDQYTNGTEVRTPDGVFDMVILAFRNHLGGFSGTSVLNVESWDDENLYSGISLGGKTIKGSARNGSGIIAAAQAGFHNFVTLVAHEYGHFIFGYYHNASVGAFGLMDGHDGSLSMAAYEREVAGWVTPDIISEVTSDKSLSESITTSDICKILAPNNEYFLLENRQRTSWVDAYYGDGDGCDLHLPGTGLMIAHIDPDNTALHKRLYWERASGGDPEEIGAGSETDPFKPGNATEFTDSTTPNSKTRSGKQSNISLTNIDQVGDEMVFDVDFLPIIYSIAPTFGDSGTAVTINGFNFLNVTSVDFDGVPALSYNVNDQSEIIATAPGNGIITVTTSSGTASSEYAFGAPEIEANPSSIVFPNARTGVHNLLSQDITVTNIGGSVTMTWNASLLSGQDWFSLTNTSGGDGDVITVTADISQLSPGEYTDIVRISDVNAINNKVDVPIRLRVFGLTQVGLSFVEGTPTYSNEVSWNNAIDGDIDGRDGTVMTISSTFQPYAIFELVDGVTDINKCSFLKKTDYYFNPLEWVSNFDLQVSTTGILPANFTTVLNGTPQSNGWNYYSISPQASARYIKLNINAPLNTFTAFGEIELHRPVTLTENITTWSGEIHIGEEVIVPAGKTLRILDNSTVLFGPNASLIVNGTLITSDVTFAGSQGANVVINSDFNVNDGAMVIGPNSHFTVNGDLGIEAGKSLIIGNNSIVSVDDLGINLNSTLNLGASSSLTVSGQLPINGAMNVGDGANVSIDGNLVVNTEHSFVTGSNVNIELNGDYNRIWGSMTLGSGTEVNIGPNAGIELNGTFTASNIEFNGSETGSSWVVFNNNFIAASGQHYTFGPHLGTMFNQNTTFGNESNVSFGAHSSTVLCGANKQFITETSHLEFGDSSFVRFDGDARFRDQSTTIFGNHNTVTFNEDFYCQDYSTVVFYNASIITYMGIFLQECPYPPIIYLPDCIINHRSGGTIGGGMTFRERCHITSTQNLVFGRGASVTARSGVVFNYQNCQIDSGAIVNYSNNVTAFHKGDFIVRGKFWADNSIIDCGNDTTRGSGITFEGSGASLSRITDTIIRDGLDGVTVDNAGPYIKNCTIGYVPGRGIKVRNIDAMPILRGNIIRNCGNYPIQITGDADPLFVSNHIRAGNKACIRIWGGDGEFRANVFKSAQQAFYLFASTSNPHIYSTDADSNGNVFNLDSLGTTAILIGGGYPEFGHYYGSDPAINTYGNNNFSNFANKYLIVNDTPQTIYAHLNFYNYNDPWLAVSNPDNGETLVGCELRSEPPSGLLKTAISKFRDGLEKYKSKDYLGAMNELKAQLITDSESDDAADALFKMSKAASKIGKLDEIADFWKDTKKSKNSQVLYQSRNWQMYHLASQGKLKQAEQIALEALETNQEKTLFVSLCSYYASYGDMENAKRIAEFLRARHKSEYLEEEIEMAMEGLYVFNQVLKAYDVKKSVQGNETIPGQDAESDSIKADETEENAPSGIYPNPFNGSTTISFNVKEYQHVNISVYDILGKRVRVLVNSKQDIGGHKIIWDGRDQYGNAAASGLYFVRIQTPENSQVFKVSYLK